MAIKKQAILYGQVEGVIAELMAKTNIENVVYSVGEDGTETYLSAVLAQILADVSALPSGTDVDTKISTAISGLINGAPETYDTLKEIADYISSNSDAMTALNSAIGNKADKSVVDAMKTTVDALGTLAGKDQVAETDLDDTLKAKVNAAAEGNHSHANKALLDTYTQTEADLAAAVAQKHEHANKTVLDGITPEKVAAWDGKANLLVSTADPAEVPAGTLYIKVNA